MMREKRFRGEINSSDRLISVYRFLYLCYFLISNRLNFLNGR